MPSTFTLTTHTQIHTHTNTHTHTHTGYLLIYAYDPETTQDTWGPWDSSPSAVPPALPASFSPQVHWKLWGLSQVLELSSPSVFSSLNWTKSHLAHVIVYLLCHV